MASKPALSKDLTAEPITENVILLDKYAHSQGISKPIYEQLYKMLSYKPTSSSPISEFSIKAITSYVEDCKSARYSNAWISASISHFSSFYKYLINEYPAEYTTDFLLSLTSIKPPELKQNSAFPLSLIQLNSIRMFIKNNPELEYTFELIYQTEIPQNKLIHCTPQNIDRSTQRFIVDGTVIGNYNNTIQGIIDRCFLTRRFDLSKPKLLYRLKQITADLHDHGLYADEKPLAFLDIRCTQDRFFKRCPVCGKLKENTSRNWVLVQFENDTDRTSYLVCDECKGEMNP